VKPVYWAVQHYTTKGYLANDTTGEQTFEPRKALQFRTRGAARIVHDALGEFASAWVVAPLVGLDWPAEFPGAWQHWPESLKLSAAEFLMEYWLRQFGPLDLVKTLTLEASMVDLDGNRLPLTARGDKFWPLFLHHTRARALKAHLRLHPDE